MKILLTTLLLLIVPYFLIAQTFPLGKSKEEVREFRATSPHSATVLSQSDTSDVYKLGELINEFYYYRDNICYKSKQVYSLLPAEKLSESVQLQRSLLDRRCKKVGYNTWTVNSGAEQILLIVMPDKNQYAVEISFVGKQD
jgi:hypothetical protein